MTKRQRDQTDRCGGVLCSTTSLKLPLKGVGGREGAKLVDNKTFNVDSFTTLDISSITSELNGFTSHPGCWQSEKTSFHTDFLVLFRVRPGWCVLMQNGRDEEEGSEWGNDGGGTKVPLGLVFKKHTSSSIWASLNGETWVSSRLCNSVEAP